MKVAVVGLWHLGSVTAACLADIGHDVVAYDPDDKVIQRLAKFQAPVFEPGLDELIENGCKASHLSFTTNESDLQDADVVWVTYDTPVDDDDVADTGFVLRSVLSLLPHCKSDAMVLISSQLPVGSTRELMQAFEQIVPNNTVRFSCSPENLRLGKAIDVFMQPDRVIVGVESQDDKAIIQSLFLPITENIIWMSVESAEMTKHALNAFLATSVVFINELATVCEQVGADAREVEIGLKSEERIGKKAYLRPGSAIAGGTLARDVNYLVAIGEQKSVKTPLFSSLLESNREHRLWSCKRVQSVLSDLSEKCVVSLGLTYKAGTDTLRRSSAVETCKWLSQQGVKVRAYDPAVKKLPQDLDGQIELSNSIAEALRDADALIIATEWPDFLKLTVQELLQHTKRPLILDPGGYLAKTFSHDDRIEYYSVGSAA